MEETRRNMTTYTSYGIWGSGKVDPGNADALLRDFIAEDLGAVYRPERVPRGSLKTVVDWFEDPELLGPGKTEPSNDILASLTHSARVDEDDIVLIALWPGEPTVEDTEYVRAFIDAGVRVVDLCQALDDLTDITPAEAKDVTPSHGDPEDQANDKPKGGRPVGSGRKLSDTKALLKNSIESEIAEAAATVAAIEARKDEVLATPSSPRQGDAYVRFTQGSDFETLGSNVTESLVLAIDAYIEFKVEQVIRQRLERDTEFRAGGVPHPETPEVKTPAPVPFGEDEEPPFDGPYLTGPMVKVWMTEDGSYRLREKTRPRRGETEGEITQEEYEKLQGEGRFTA
jgi:hypothetical protein